MSSWMARDKSLILFSGGKDSFIAACMEIESGFEAVLFSCNGGFLAAEENLLHGVTRLKNRYGADKVSYAGVYPTAATLQRLNTDWTYMAAAEWGQKYPHLINAQVQCLNCQTAMWVAAIAYAKAKEIRRVCSGYRSSDEFCTGSPDYCGRIKVLAEQEGVKVRFPVWDKREWQEDPYSRDLEMVQRSFEPQVLEPKCLVGRPVSSRTSEMEQEMMEYFDASLAPKFKEYVENLATIFKYLKLSEKTFDPITFPTPTGEGGVY